MNRRVIPDSLKHNTFHCCWLGKRWSTKNFSRVLTGSPNKTQNSVFNVSNIVVSKLERKITGLNPAIKKLRKLNFFQTVNNARVLWDPRAKPKGLLGGHLNIHSIIPKSDQIKHLLAKSNLDFLCLSETWLHKNSPSSALHIPGYNVFRKDRVEGRGGGLLFYIKDCISCKEIQCHAEMDLECICLDVMLSPQMYFILIGLYRPPSAKSVFHEKLCTVLRECTSGKEVILMGDFNINWEDKSSKKALKQITDRFDLTQLVKGPTRIISTSSTQIDLVFSNKPERVIKSFNMVTGLSDHNLIIIARKLNKNRSYLISNTKPCQFRIPKNDVCEFEKAIKNINWNELISGTNVDVDTHVFLSTIQNTTKLFLKKSKFKGASKYTLPWINGDIRKLMKERDRALQIFLKTKLTTDRYIFTSLRNRVIKNIRVAKANFFISLIGEAKGNHKQIWDKLKKLTGKWHNNTTKQLEIRDNGSLINGAIETATLLNSYFVNSVKMTVPINHTGILVTPQTDISQSALSLMEVSESKVNIFLNSLKTSKSKDIFGLDSIFLKRHADLFTGTITKVS